MSGRPSVPAAPATGHRLSQIPLKVPLESKTRSTRRLVLKGGRTHSSGVDFWCRDAPTGRTECVSCFAFELACFLGARTLKGMFLLALHFRFYFRLGVHFNWIRRRAPRLRGCGNSLLSTSRESFSSLRRVCLVASEMFLAWDVRAQKKCARGRNRNRKCDCECECEDDSGLSFRAFSDGKSTAATTHTLPHTPEH